MAASVYDIPQEGYPLFSAAGGGGGLESMTRAMVRSLGQQPTGLAAAFFAPGNVDEVQDRMREVVFRRTGHRIDRQSDEQLLILMRNVFVEYARHEAPDVPSEVRRLDNVVLAQAVPIVAAGLAQYLSYLRDASQLPPPLPHGQATSIKGTRTLEMDRGFK